MNTRVRVMRFPTAVRHEPAIDACFDSHDGHPTACAGDLAALIEAGYLKCRAYAQSEMGGGPAR